MNKRPAVYTDMDGVITNFVGQVASVFGIEESQLEEDLRKGKTYSIPDVLDLKPSEFWKRIEKEGEEFWSDMKVYPWAKKLLLDINEFNVQVYIATSPTLNPACLSGKLKKLKSLFGDNFRNYVITPQKHLLARESRTTILIDDSLNNISKFRRYGGQTILFPQPWNGSAGKTGQLVTRYITDQLHQILENEPTDEDTRRSDRPWIKS